MTILYVACEDSDGMIMSGATIGAGSFFDPNYARCCFVPGSSNDAYVMTPALAAQQTLWVRARLLAHNQNNNNQEIISLMNGAGNPILALSRISIGDLNLCLRKHNGTAFTSLVQNTSFQLTDEFITKLDVGVRYATDGWMRVYFDNQLVLSWTGDTTGRGNTTGLTQVKFHNCGWGNTAWSEIVLADRDTRAIHGVKRLFLSGEGSVTGWTNNMQSGAFNIEAIREQICDDATAVVSDTAGQTSTWTFEPPGNFYTGKNIHSVVTTARALKGATGPTKLGLGVKANGAVHTVTKTLDTGFASYQTIFANNPTTGVAFTASDLATLELALTAVA